jgi:hypothetical protein
LPQAINQIMTNLEQCTQKGPKSRGTQWRLIQARVYVHVGLRAQKNIKDYGSLLVPGAAIHPTTLSGGAAARHLGTVQV